MQRYFWKRAPANTDDSAENFTLPLRGEMESSEGVAGESVRLKLGKQCPASVDAIADLAEIQSHVVGIGAHSGDSVGSVQQTQEGNLDCDGAEYMTTVVSTNETPDLEASEST